MKKLICCILLMNFGLVSAFQSVVKDSLKTRIISFSPSKNDVDKVNGLVIGLGLAFNEGVDFRIVNGINLEINPLSPLFMMFADPIRHGFYEIKGTVLNGLNISTGNYSGSDCVAINGISATLFNDSFSVNGISINGFYNYATKLNGVHVSFASNYSKKANGLFLSISNFSETGTNLQIGVFNKSLLANGIQLGLFNKSEKYCGVQIGLFNKTKSIKGVQLGFWNSNSKRSLPFLNF